ncbi:MAG: hypothetical protein HYW10_04640 [Candidatus Omnitrophica bacterium]|nr:hypothetical protein [Candidatus Omnitrophota bacterium]
MMVRVISALVVAIGVLAACVGVAIARQRLRSAHRIYRRTASLSTGILDGWSAWFLVGFSTMTMGIRWLYAVGSWLIWTLIGVGFVGLGIRLFHRL